ELAKSEVTRTNRVVQPHQLTMHVFSGLILQERSFEAVDGPTPVTVELPDLRQTNKQPQVQSRESDDAPKPSPHSDPRAATDRGTARARLRRRPPSPVVAHSGQGTGRHRHRSSPDPNQAPPCHVPRTGMPSPASRSSHTSPAPP